MNRELSKRIENIVKNEVLTCQTSLVEKLLENEIVSYDDITNMYKDNSEEIEEKQEEIDNVQNDDRYQELDEKYMNDELTDNEQVEYDAFTNDIETLENDLSELESEQEEPQDIFEWWVITDWLANKLEAYGEPILRSDYETWWGRTCSGQSISMDYVIEQIVKDLQ